MQVCYWGEVNSGAREYGLYFNDFPECCATSHNPQTLRDEGKRLLQLFIDGMLERNLEIPKPSGIELPLSVSQYFIGYFPITVIVPDWIVQSWIDDDALSGEIMETVYADE